LKILKSARERARFSAKYAMPIEELDKSESARKELRVKQAQAMLHLFEADRGRAAATLEEIKEWACTQNEEHLRFKVDQFLSTPRAVA